MMTRRTLLVIYDNQGSGVERGREGEREGNERCFEMADSSLEKFGGQLC